MKFKIQYLLITTALLVSFSGCDFNNQDRQNPENQSAQTAETEEKLKDPGAIPLDYPVVSTGAKAGDYILAPLIEELDIAFDKGLHRGYFTFFKAKMVKPGEKESLIEDHLGDRNTIPNSLIIPIKPDQTTSPGDILLTFTPDTLQMIRAITTETGTESKSPTVYYLTDYLREESALESNTFHVLTDELQPGMTVLIATEDGSKEAIVVNISNSRVLLVGQLGQLQVADKDQLTLMSSQPEVMPGDTIIVPFISDYKDVIVSEVMPEIGQVIGTFNWAGQESSEIFYYGGFMKDPDTVNPTED